MEEKPKSILIVEDEIIVAKDISEILVALGYEISGIANNARSAMELFKARIPDLIICDINLGKRESGIDFIRETRKIQSVPVVYLTAYADENTVADAFETNPDSYLTKPFTNEQLSIAVGRVLMKSGNRDSNSSDLPEPTRREMQIIKMVAKGLSSKQIAKKLSISFETVQSHRKNMLHKYKVKSSTELVALAHHSGWLS